MPTDRIRMSSPAPRIDPERSLLDHLAELRLRLLRSVAAVAVMLVLLMPFSRALYGLLARPLMRHLPEGAGRGALDVASPVLAPFKTPRMCGPVAAWRSRVSAAW